jgi:thiamine-monophosphate kinase
MKTMKEIGERKIVNIIIELLEKIPVSPIPYGDDISAVDLGKGKLAYLKCDMLVDRTDVPPGMNLIQVGRKAVVSVVSDFASKGIQPVALLSSIGMPSDFKENDVKKIVRGLNLGAKEYGTYVIGGDTNESTDLIIDCIGFGLGDKNAFVSRYGAKPGNLLAVTGFFGETSAGLKIVKEEFRIPHNIRKKLLDAIYEPKARLQEGLALVKTKALTSSIDSSDGLAASLFELSERSGVGFLLEKIPISKYAIKFAEINDLDPISLALYGGEEYELVFTFQSKDLFKVQRTLKENLIVIGEVTSEKRIEVKTGYGKKKILPLGWEHFK